MHGPKWSYRVFFPPGVNRDAQQKQSGGQQLTSQWELLMARSKGLQWVWAPDGATHPRDKRLAISRMAIDASAAAPVLSQWMCELGRHWGCGSGGRTGLRCPPQGCTGSSLLAISSINMPICGGLCEQHFRQWSPAWLWTPFTVGALGWVALL